MEWTMPIVATACCPQCHGRMTRHTDDQGRGWLICTDCGAQIPTESGYREVNKEARELVKCNE